MTSLRLLAGFALSLCVAAGAFAAPADAPMIRVEPEVQPFTEASALSKAKRPKAQRVRPVQLAAPGPGEGIEVRTTAKVGVPQQIGFGRDVPGFDDDVTISSLEWENQPGGGYVGALSVNSPGAAALRIGILVNRMLPGATLRFYGPDDAKVFEVTGQEIIDTIDRNLHAGEHGRDAHTYWSPIIESATLVMEIELPAGTRPSQLRISAPQVTHMVTSSGMDFQMPKAAAACEVDATCQAGTWGTQMNAVARMRFNVGASGFLCSGTLLADQDATTTIPYFLSAYHCISTQASASSLQTDWFFRSGSCGGGLGGTVALGGGATLLYGSNTTDTSFMRLNNPPPGGAVYAGWSISGPYPIGSGTTGLHQPRGDMLKISGGQIGGYWVCTPPANGFFTCSSANGVTGTFIGNDWSTGVTEPGSSGSGLFINGGRYLIGQLYGGSSSCSAPATDFYGRFDTAYNAGLKNWLSVVETLSVTRGGAGTGTVSSLPAGINCGATCSAPFAQDSQVLLSAMPNVGSAFSSWGGACSGTSTNCFVTMNAAKSVTANFEIALQPSITISKAGTGTGVVSSSPPGFMCGTQCALNLASGTMVTLIPTPGPGSVFAGWSGSCIGTGLCSLNVNTAMVVTATFNLGTSQPMAVTKSGSGAGTVASSPAGINCGATCNANFTLGTVVTLTATPASGSTFSGWSSDCSSSGTGSCTITMNAAKSVEAVFTSTIAPPPPPPPGTPSITVTKTGTGTGTITSSPWGFNCGVPCQMNLAAGTVITLIPAASAGSTFAGWGGACSGTGNCTLTVNGPLAATATFNGPAPPPPPPQLLNVSMIGTGTGTITSSPAGINCGTACSANFPRDTVVTLTAAAAAGSAFSHWSGDCSGTTPTCTLTMSASSAPRLGAAVFNNTTPMATLLVTAHGTGFGVITSSPAGIACTFANDNCTKDFPVGTVVTLTAAATGGSIFSGWGLPCSGTGTCTVTLNGPVNVSGFFDPPPPPPPPIQPLTVTLGGTGAGVITGTPPGFQCPPDCSVGLPEGMTVTLTASPELGSMFAGWGGECTGTGATCTLTMNDLSIVRRVTARFNLIARPPGQFLLSITLPRSQDGTVIAEGELGIQCTEELLRCAHYFPAGTVLTLTAIKDGAMVFSGWGGACSGTATTCIVTMNADLDVAATFTPLWVLSVSAFGTGSGVIASSPAGIACGSVCVTYFEEDSTVTLTATPGSASVFAGWAGYCSGTGPCIVTMDTQHDVSAIFNLAPPPPPPPPPTGPPSISVVKTGTGTGSITSSPWGFNCGTPCRLNLAAGTVITLIPAASPGSTFAGWTGACSGNANCTLTVNAALTATATFNATSPPAPILTLSVTGFGGGSGTVTSSPAGINCGTTCTAAFALGTMVSLTATPTSGSIFAGWGNGSCSGTGPCTVPMDTGRIVSATFVPAPWFPLSVNVVGWDGIVTSDVPGINCGETPTSAYTCATYFPPGLVVTLTASAHGAMVFAGWSGACSGTGPSCAVTMNAAASVTATFVPAPPPSQFLLQLNITGGDGSVSINPPGRLCGASEFTCALLLDPGTVVTLTPIPTGYTMFSGWSGACSGTGTCTVTMNTARIVTATFAFLPPPPPGPPSITVVKNGTGTGTVTSSPWGLNCGIPCFLNVAAGQVLTLIPTPSAGSTFTGWSGACSGTGNCTLTINSAMSATATFSGSGGPPPPPPTMYTLSVANAGTGTGSVASTPAGISCGATCSASFAQGTMVSLTATPTGGSTFAGWSGACSGTGSCTVTMNAAASVTATFTAAPPPPPPPTGTPSVRVLKAGTGVGLVTSSPWGFYCGGGCFLNLQAGTVITLIPTANAGSTFTGWSGACTGTGNCTLTVNSALTATATFQ